MRRQAGRPPSRRVRAQTWHRRLAPLLDARQLEHAAATMAQLAQFSASSAGSKRTRLPAEALPDGGFVRRMDTVAVQRICSDQVIVDLQSALKELIENALDAGATKIDVRLKENGVELLEVGDGAANAAKPKKSKAEREALRAEARAARAAKEAAA